MDSQSYNVIESQLLENEHIIVSGSFQAENHNTYSNHQQLPQPHVILTNQFPRSNPLNLSQHQFQPHFGLNRVVAPYPPSEQLNGNGCSFQDLLHAPLPDANAQTFVFSKGAKKGSNGSKIRWTVDEDIALAKSYLYITTDAIVGKDQTSLTMWNRIFKSWKDRMGKYDEMRNPKSLQCRWGIIQGAVNKFHGIYDTLDRAHQSGTAISDMVKSAMRIYVETGDGSSFKFIHCWEMMKSNPKWCSQMLEKTNTLKKTKLTNNSLISSPPSTPNASTFVASNENDLIELDAPENETNDVKRPQGRKGSKEKKRRLAEQKDMEDGFKSLQCTLEKQFALNQQNMEARDITKERHGA